MDSFVAWTVGYLRTAETSRVAGWTDPQLHERVTFACGRGLDRGLRDSQSLLRFVVLVLAAGPGLEADPRVRTILDDRSRDAEARLDALEAQPELLATVTIAAGPDPWSRFDPHALPT